MSTLTLNLDLADPKAAKFLRQIAEMVEGDKETSESKTSPAKTAVRRQVVLPPNPDELPPETVSLDDRRLEEAMGRHGMRRR